MFSFLTAKQTMVDADAALTGRASAIPTASTHFVNGRPLTDAVPEGMEEAVFGMGCFWVWNGCSGDCQAST